MGEIFAPLLYRQNYLVDEHSVIFVVLYIERIAYNVFF